MDEIDIKGALRRYVTTDMPPFALVASDLVVKGRQRQLLRVGMACLSSGSVVLVAALFTSATLTNPLTEPAYRPLVVAGCDRSLPVKLPQISPESSAEDAPTPPVSAGPSQPVVTVEPSEIPETGEPTQQPSADPTSYPPDTPSQMATGDTPSQMATGLAPQATRWPSTAPRGPLPDDAEPAKLATMTCYVKGAAMILFPNSSFAPASEPPMELVRWPELNFANGWHPTYSVRAVIVDEGRSGIFYVRVAPLAAQPTQPPSVDVRRLGNGRTAYIHRDPFGDSVQVTTARSWIIVMSDGRLTEAQSIALAMAPELDVFG